MPFQISLPDPSHLRAGKEAYVPLPPGTVLHRIHHEKYAADGFNASAGGNARFSPIRNAAGAIIPTIYAGETFACAACEIILRCPDTPPVDPASGLPTFQIVFPSDFREHMHSEIVTTADLNLVNLTIAGQRKIGIDHNALLAGPRSTYPETRAWAEAIHRACPSAHGLYYSSFQYGPDFAIVLFGDRVASGVLQPASTRPVAGADCHGEIVKIAESLSIDYGEV